MPTSQRSPKKITRSARLQKCESVYARVLRNGLDTKTKASKQKTTKQRIRSPKRPSKAKKPVKTSSIKADSKSKRKEVAKTKKGPVKSVRKLTDYQKFVQRESRKSRYKGMAPQDRMSAIGAEWRRRKK